MNEFSIADRNVQPADDQAELRLQRPIAEWLSVAAMTGSVIAATATLIVDATVGANLAVRQNEFQSLVGGISSGPHSSLLLPPSPNDLNLEAVVSRPEATAQTTSANAPRNEP